MDGKKENYLCKFILPAVATLAIILAVLFLYYHFVISYLGFSIPSDSQGKKNAGLFGDVFGGANALFSGLAFMGVAISILLQNQVLKDTKEAAREQKILLDLQTQATRKQQFENTFFELLRLYNDVVEKISYTQLIHGREKIVVLGREAIRGLHKDIEYEIFRDFTSIYNEKAPLVERLKTMLDRNHNPLQAYFRIVHNIMEFIDQKGELSDTEKGFYAGLFHAQFSTEELNLLALNCLGQERKKIKSLMRRYNMFKRIEKSNLITDEIIAELEQGEEATVT